MTRRLADLTRALASLAALAALTIGIPALLWQLGGPPGSRIIDTLRDQLASDSSRTEALLSGTLLIIAWVCWAQLAYAIAIEVVAAARGRSARRAAVLPGLQALAARLVTSLTLISSSLLPTVHAAAAVAPLQRVVDTPIETSWDLGSIASPNTTVHSGSAVATAAAKTYVAGPRDTFWSIAETTLGEGLRWTDIRDANLGRTMPDGTAITPSTETVQAGWELHLPAGAVLPFSDETELAAQQVEVEPGDHFWAIAEEAMTDAWGRDPSDTEVAPYWADVVDLNAGRLLPPSDPDLIYPGQVFELPAVPADPHAPEEPAVIPPPAAEEPEPSAPPLGDPEPAEDPVVATPTTATPTPVQETAPTTTVTAEIATEDGSGSPTTSLVAVGIGALGVSAGTLALTLRRRRAHQSAKREPGHVIADPPPDAVQYEAAIRPIADTEAARWIEATNKLLTRRLATATTLPAVIAMRAGQFGVEVLLDEPCEPPEGFAPTADGPTIWRLDADLTLADVEAEASGAQPYSPALLPVGRTPAGELLLDLEQLGALSLEGSPERIVAWQRAIAVAAAATPWSSECELVAIGMPDDIAQLPNVTVPGDPIAWARACMAEMTKLNERLASTPYQQRVAPGEVFHPRIVFVGPDCDEIACQLADAAALVNTPLAALAAASLAGAERIHFTDDGCVLEPYGISFDPLASDAAEPVRVAELLDNAESEPQPAAERETDATPDPADGESVSEILERVMAPRPIEVEILTRQPRVHGLDKEIPTKQLSVLCYLAYHRDVSSQRLRDTFWPTATHRSTADNAISELRRALGTSEDGEQRLTAARNTGNYELGDDVGCDWTRVAELLAATRNRANEEAAELLAAALDLVSGSPGAETAAGTFDWLVEEPGTYRGIESVLVDAACRLGEMVLTAGDVERAERAAQKALLLVPGHEGLYRVRLRVAAARRDFDEVDRLYRELCARLTEHSVWEAPDEATEAILAAARLARAS